MPTEHLCAGCGEPVGDRYIVCDLPKGFTFSQLEFWTFGKSQFCRECIIQIEACDETKWQR